MATSDINLSVNKINKKDAKYFSKKGKEFLFYFVNGEGSIEFCFLRHGQILGSGRHI